MNGRKYLLSIIIELLKDGFSFMDMYHALACLKAVGKKDKRKKIAGLIACAHNHEVLKSELEKSNMEFMKMVQNG